MSDEFLEQFAVSRRSTIANQFYGAVRAGASTVEEVLAWVGRDCLRRIEKPWTNDEQREAQKALLVSLAFDGAREFARIVIRNERLPYEQRQKEKQKRAIQYQSQAMARQSPTEKQLKYLKALGCDKIPASKLEASELIEEYKLWQHSKTSRTGL